MPFFLYQVTSRQTGYHRMGRVPIPGKEDPSLLSVIQYHWDTWLKDSQLFLIVSGSSISMMEEMTMRYVSPLFGRRTGQYLIKPLRFTDILEHFPDLTTTVEHYAVFGGTPAYIFKADKNKDIYENIISRILTDDSILFQDTEFISCPKYQNPDITSILRAIAEGNTTPSKFPSDRANGPQSLSSGSKPPSHNQRFLQENH